VSTKPGAGQTALKKGIDVHAALESYDPGYDAKALDRLSELAREACHLKLCELGKRHGGPRAKPGEPLEEFLWRKNKE